MSRRIERSFIQDLIGQADIVNVISRYTPLQQRGNHLKCCCPFHQEKTPSFTVSPTKQFFYCFGCHAHGNALDYIMKYEKIDFVNAVEVLAGIVGVDIRYEEGGNARENLPYEEAKQWLGRYRDYYRQQAAGDEAQRYLQRRRLTSDTAEQFQIGFVPAGWQNALDSLKPGKHDLKLLQDLGLTGQGKQGPFDRLRHRLIFPILDQRGQVVAFGGRVVDPKDEPKYLNSPEHLLFKKRQVLYGLYQASQSEQLKKRGALVVEGYMDVVQLHQHGFDHAVATLGTALTTEHIKVLQRYTKTITFCFDGDRAGQEAAWRATQTALPWLEKGLRFEFVFLPQGHDPDSLLLNADESTFGTLLDQAQPLTVYFFDHCREGLDLNKLEDKLTYSQRCLKAIHACESPWVQSLFLETLSQELHIPVEQLRTETRHTNPMPSPVSSEPPQSDSDSEPLVSALIRSLILSPGLIDEIDNYERLQHSPFKPHQQLFRFLGWIKEEQPANTAALYEALRNNPARYRWAERFSLTGPHYTEPSALQFIIHRLCRGILSDQIESLIEQGELSEERQLEVQQLLSQRQQLDKKLQQAGNVEELKKAADTLE